MNCFFLLRRGFMIESKDARVVANILSGIGDPIRMVVVHYLTAGPHYVGQLATLVGIPIVNMSHHLGVMRAAGIVENTKNGRMVMYSLNPAIYTTQDSHDVIGDLKAGQWKVTIVKPNAGPAPAKKSAAKGK